MIEMIKPMFVVPVRPARMYYITPQTGTVAGAQRVETANRFGVDGTTENVKVVDDLEWRLDLEEYLVAKKKYTHYLEAWTENIARIYNWVLQHCPPDLEAELQNSSNWSAGQSAQNSIALFLIICDVTHNTK